MQKLLWIGLTAWLVGGEIAFPNPAFAQSRIEPDDTLGGERSTVIQNFRGTPNEVIEGGARRGRNLFHSFREFNVEEGRGAYFLNDGNFRNIFSRVTGSNPSQILGELGTIRIENGQIFPNRDNPANLYLINPNGIIFGPSARLNVGGSFVGTTANAIGFGDLGLFSATNPEVPSQLLTVNPSAFLFSQLPVGNIVNLATAPSRPGSSFLGLRVGNRENLTLLGGNIENDGGKLNAFGGRVDVGAVGGLGSVLLNTDGRIQFPDELLRETVSFTDGALIDVRLNQKGSIEIIAQDINVIGSRLLAGIDTDLGTTQNQAGDIVLDAEGDIQIRQSSQIFNNVNRDLIGNGGDVRLTARNLLIDESQISASMFGQGNAGDVIVNAQDRVFLDTSGIFNQLGADSIGQGGSIAIAADSLDVKDDSLISASTFGKGDSGNVFITTRGLVFLSNSNIFNNAGQGSIGNGGQVNVIAQSLSLDDVSSIGASTFSSGNAGSIYINVHDTINLEDDSSILNIIQLSEDQANRNTGGIQIQARGLSLEGASMISSETLGRGNSVGISIQTDDFVSLVGNSNLLDSTATATITSTMGPEGEGQAGNIVIQTDTLILDGARVQAGTFGRGNAGNISIRARDTSLLNNAAVFSNINPGATGNGGNIIINGNSLLVDRSVIQAIVANPGNELSAAQGNAGDITINVSGDLVIQGEAVRNNLNAVYQGLVSAVAYDTTGAAGNIQVIARDVYLINQTAQIRNVLDGRAGSAGNIDLRLHSLSMDSGAEITSYTAGQGNAGNISVQASDAVNLRGSIISSGVIDGGQGNSGRIELNSRSLFLTAGAQLQTGVGLSRVGNSVVGISSGDLPEAEGNGNSININVEDAAIFDGVSGNSSLDPGSPSGIFSGVSSSVGGIGGDVNIRANSLLLKNSAVVSSQTFGTDRAGDINAIVGQLTLSNNAYIRASTFGTGRAGSIQINSGQLHLFNDSEIVTATTSTADAGNIIVTTDRLILQSGSSLLTDALTDSTGRGGTLEVDASQAVEIIGISATEQNADGPDASGLYAQTRGAGRAGNLQVTTRDLILRDGGTISTETSGSGRGGDLDINASRIEILGGSSEQSFSSGINAGAETGSSGDGGDVRIITGRLLVRNGGFVSSSAEIGSLGNAGNVLVNASDSIDLIGQTFDRENPSAITVAVEQQGTIGNAGDLTITTRRLSIQDGAAILAQNYGNGSPGTIHISADSIEVIGGNDPSLINATVGPLATGKPGAIEIDTGTLQLRNSGQIATTTFGQVDAGDIWIEANSIDIGGAPLDRLFPSGILAFSLPLILEAGQGGNIDIQTERIRLADSGRISASTYGQANAGNISLQASDFISLDSSSVISTTVEQGAIGNGGNITLNTNTLNLNRSDITASTSGTGNAGNIRIQDVEQTSLNHNSTISTTVNTDAVGNGGSITLNTNTLYLNDRARISAQSTGRGTAGDIQINTENLNANDSTLETAAIRSAGGTIQINPNDRTGRITLNNSNITTNSGKQGGNISLGAEQIRLQGDSDITTSSGGNGGNIDLTAASIIAFDDSDILANSSNARGGNITLNTPVFFGSGYVPNQTATDGLDGNNRVDVNATGSTASGTIQTPDTSFIQNSLSDLPATAIDPDTLLSNSCIARTRAGGRFLITGTGGLPTDRPDTLPVSPYPTDTVRTESDDATWQPGDPIVEPQGVYQLPDGRLVMSRECGSH